MNSTSDATTTRLLAIRQEFHNAIRDVLNSEDVNESNVDECQLQEYVQRLLQLEKRVADIEGVLAKNESGVRAEIRTFQVKANEIVSVCDDLRENIQTSLITKATVLQRTRASAGQNILDSICECAKLALEE